MDLQQMMETAYQTSYNDEFYHYGRKGMKWGEHIFGRDRRSSSSRQRSEAKSSSQSTSTSSKPPTSTSTSSKTKTSTVSNVIKMDRKALKAAKKEAKKASRREKREQARRERYLRNPRLLYKHRKEFTSEEITQAVSRFQVEANLRSYSVKNIEDGKKIVTNIVDMVDAGRKGYNNFAAIYNATVATRRGGNNLPYIDDPNRKAKKQQSDND